MTMLDATAAPLGADARAFVLLKSRGRLDLLDPDPQAWTDGDLAAGLSRTMRWGGASQWGHPLSVAQHSLTVLAIREAEGPLIAQEGLRELLHDATEFMLGWDCIAPLKAQLGAPFRQLELACRPPSTPAINCRHGPPRPTRSTSGPIVSPSPLRRSSRRLEPNGHGRGARHRDPPASRRSSSSERVCALGAAAAPSRARSLHAAIPRTCSRAPAPAAIPNALLRTRAKTSCNAMTSLKA
jgi:hypothetical protein